MDGSKKKRAVDESSDESSSSSAGSTEFSYKNFRPRKKSAHRRTDAGRRYQRGRIYDSALGVTCHFCRQKTTEKHVVCCGPTCVLAYCRNCLHNRHGEDLDIETADEDYSWLCPKCRGGCGPGCKNCCNCTFCRKKQNLRPPKIPFSEMQAYGFDNVHDYLIHLETGESPKSISARKLGKGWCRTHEKNVPKSHQNSKDHDQRKADTRETDTCKGPYEEASSVIHEQSEMDTGKGLDEVASSVTQGCCHTHEKSVPKSHQNSKVHEQRETDTRETDIGKGSYEVASSAIHEQTEKDTCKGLDEVASSVTQGTTQVHRESFPSQFCSRNSFKEKLEAKLAESFNSQELTKLWDAIKCRKPLCKTSETPQGGHSFPTRELGYSYIDHHPDLARELTATIDKEEKLKFLRGFFFWLEHASMLGSFKPWLENDKDAECLELAGPDCQVLGVLINLDEHQYGEKQEDTKPKIKQDSSYPQAKINFNWDAEDVKPRIKEESVKFSSFNTQIHVKEEQDTS